MTKVIQNPYGLIGWFGLIMFHIAFVLSYAWHVFLDSYTVNVTYEYWTFEIGFIHFLTNIEMMQLSHVVANGLWNDRQRSLVYMLLREFPLHGLTLPLFTQSTQSYFTDDDVPSSYQN